MLAQNNRHYGVLNIFSSQDWLNFEPKIRNNADVILLWFGMSKQRLKLIYDQIQLPIDFKEFIKIYNKATVPPPNFLFINVPQKEFRRNLDEKIIID